jgi:hypothetical protein
MVNAADVQPVQDSPGSGLFQATGPFLASEQSSVPDDFMKADLEDVPYVQPEEGDYGATVSLNRKRKGRRK